MAATHQNTRKFNPQTVKTKLVYGCTLPMGQRTGSNSSCLLKPNLCITRWSIRQKHAAHVLELKRRALQWAFGRVVRKNRKKETEVESSWLKKKQVPVFHQTPHSQITLHVTFTQHILNRLRTPRRMTAIEWTLTE